MLEQVLRKSGEKEAVAAGGSGTTGTPDDNRGASAPSVRAEDQASARISEDDWQVLNARVEEMQQDKVESASKYRIKLSGLVLLNAFAVSGQVESIDVPIIAVPRTSNASSGSLGGSLRQSILGLTGFGPEIFGAHTTADVQMDFFGGLPVEYSSLTSGLLRLRVARIRFEWPNTSVVGGLDTPFFAPNQPTSYLSVAVPAFGAAGKLWDWAPTIRIEQKFNTSVSQLRIQAGLIDAPAYSEAFQADRTPSAGESSRQPTYAVRFSANGYDGDRPVSLGVSGIYSPARFGARTRVARWGATGDWKVEFFQHFEWTGEFFVGKGLDGFGGVPAAAFEPSDRDFNSTSGPALARITMIGGWSQLKVRVNARNEFNLGAGTGGRNSSEFREIVERDAEFSSLSPRNQMFFVNYIFRPRADLVLSPEFRRLRTYPATGAPAIADQVGLSAGFIF
jgi:hypothetical protein